MMDKDFMLFIGIIAVGQILTAGIGFASENAVLKEYDFDSYFSMDE